MIYLIYYIYDYASHASPHARCALRSAGLLLHLAGKYLMIEQKYTRGFLSIYIFVFVARTL